MWTGSGLFHASGLACIAGWASHSTGVIGCAGVVALMRPSDTGCA